MAELLLVANPHRRKRRKNPRRRARRSNPRRRHRRSNPFGRRRHRSRRRNPMFRSRRRRRNPGFRSYRRRRHRNPSLAGITARIVPTFKAGFIGAGGALANDVLWGLLNPYLPSLLTSAGSAAPIIQYAVQMLTAIGVGMLGGMARLPGQEMAIGAATCATHDFLKSQLQTMAPTLFGSGAPLALSGFNGMGAYLSGSAPIVGTATFPATYLPNGQNVQMGAYLSGDNASGPGTYMDDAMGQDYWAAH
jgi:hypothetical protein